MTRSATYSLAETINGLAGNDAIDARGGADVVSGGEGKDKLTGGAGGDGFLFDVKLKGKNVDHITDFLPGDGHAPPRSRHLQEAQNRRSQEGRLLRRQQGRRRQGRQGSVVYDKKSGKVYYDADGPGGASAKLVAILDGSPNELKADDFVIVA